jgi:uncharacterized lipoprotein YmbA
VRRAHLALAALALAGCLSRPEPANYRYFRPLPPETDAPPQERAHGIDLKLDAVRAADYLRERIAWRTPAGEYGFHETLRWAELPEDLATRALERELFRRRGLERTLSYDAPRLAVTLVAFEEVRGTPRAVEVAIAASLIGRDERSLLELSESARRELADGGPEELCAALADALAELAARVADEVARALAERGAADEPAPPADGAPVNAGG